MPSHLSDQIFKGCVSWVALCMSKVKVNDWVSQCTMHFLVLSKTLLDALTYSALCSD